MIYWELAVYTTDEGSDAVCAALNGVGLMELSIEESHEKAMAFILENARYWDFADKETIGTDAPCVKAYLADLPENLAKLEAAKAAILRLPAILPAVNLGSLACSVTRVDEQDWANNWKKYYKPLEIGKRLLVLPSWEPCPETTRTVLRLDPGMAFGTGAHHTTRLCLELLEGAVHAGDEMLDLGCGSGILSIAALLLGAKHATAVDIDPIAKSIARENAEMNGIADEDYTIRIGDVLTDTALRGSLAGRYPVVAANIVADVIIALAPFAREKVATGGVFLCSGIIDERCAEVEAALDKAGFTVETHLAAGGWNAYLTR